MRLGATEGRPNVAERNLIDVEDEAEYGAEEDHKNQHLIQVEVRGEDRGLISIR